jgi:hypothetical protein
MTGSHEVEGSNPSRSTNVFKFNELAAQLASRNHVILHAHFDPRMKTFFVKGLIA